MKSKIKYNLRGNHSCPKGLICFKNLTFYFIATFIMIFGYHLYKKHFCNYHTHYPNNQHYLVKTALAPDNLNNSFYTEDTLHTPRDVLLDPYAPPLKDNNYNINYNGIRNSINRSTNIGSTHNAKFRQVGLMSPHDNNGKNPVSGPVPLMGKPLYSNRNKWQYYSMSDQYNSIKIPVSVKGKSGMSEYGCDELFNGDTVYLDGLKDIYIVTMYDNDHLKYLP